MHYNPTRFYARLANSELGRNLWVYVSSEATAIELQCAAKLGRPAVEAITKEIGEQFPQLLQLDSKSLDEHKKMIGHMVRQVMEARGWTKVADKAMPVRRAGLINNGARYREVSKATIFAPSERSCVKAISSLRGRFPGMDTKVVRDKDRV